MLVNVGRRKKLNEVMRAWMEKVMESIYLRCHHYTFTRVCACFVVISQCINWNKREVLFQRSLRPLSTRLFAIMTFSLSDMMDIFTTHKTMTTSGPFFALRTFWLTFWNEKERKIRFLEEREKNQFSVSFMSMAHFRRNECGRIHLIHGPVVHFFDWSGCCCSRGAKNDSNSQWTTDVSLMATKTLIYRD